MLSNGASLASTSGSGWATVFTLGNAATFRQFDVVNLGAVDVLVSFGNTANPVYVKAGTSCTLYDFPVPAGAIQIQRVGGTDASSVFLRGHVN